MALHPDLSPRILAPWESPQPGDITFEAGTSLAALITRWGMKEAYGGLSHAGVIASVSADQWTMIETRGMRVEEAPITEMRGYVMRLSETQGRRDEVVAAARAYVGRPYDYGAIARFAVRALRRRWWTRWLAPIVDRFVPDEDDALAVVCSDHVSRAILDVFGPVPGLEHPAETTPNDLFRALVGFRCWISL